MNNNVLNDLATAVQNTPAIELSSQCYRIAALSDDTTRTFFVNLGDLIAQAPTPKATKAVTTVVKGTEVAKSTVNPTDEKPSRKGVGGRPKGSKNKPKDDATDTQEPPQSNEDDFSEFPEDFRPEAGDDNETLQLKYEMRKEYLQDMEAEKMSDEEAQDMARIVAQSEEDATTAPADTF